jgi:hypothetical protein
MKDLEFEIWDLGFEIWYLGKAGFTQSREEAKAPRKGVVDALLVQ